MAFFGTNALAIEEPPYTVLASYDQFELRSYPDFVVAETLVKGDAEDASSTGFRILAGYLFGRNGAQERMEMTAPVMQAQLAPNQYRVQFTMPKRWKLETLPVPDDARVVLKWQTPHRVAVLRYSGTWSSEGFETHLLQLQKALAAAGLAFQGPAIWARYDPPWMPWFLRRNEIWLEVN